MAAGMKLNLGSGTQILKGWTGVDIFKAEIQYNLRKFPWPWDAGSASEILASHILEHFTREQGVQFLEECHRILEPYGRLHIAVPDMDKFIDCHLTGDFTPLQGYGWTDLNYLCGGDEREIFDHNKHKYMYCFASLAYTLLDLGFGGIVRRVKPLDFDNPAYAHLSLYVDAVK
jgi:hypothetical protein